MIDIQGLLKKQKFDISNFETARNSYFAYLDNIDINDLPLPKRDIASEAFCKSIGEILNIAVKDLDLKESFEIFLPDQKRIETSAAAITKTTNINITFGFFRGFYIVTPIINPHNIKFMKDEFWTLLFKLSTLGEFSFKESEVPDKRMRNNHPHLFNKTGNYFKLLRNYFLFETNNSNISNLGNIAVFWDDSISFELLIPNVCECYKIMYRLNFLLWQYDNKRTKYI